jgi:hypothetical protein
MRPTKNPKAPLKKFVAGFPNERVAMDVVGPLKESKNGNKYILCMTDHFSKFTRAFAMPDQVAKRVAKLFVQEWVYMWGEPMSLHTDQGSNFESELLKQVCMILKVEKTRTTPYHPQGNAQVERYNQTVMNIVSKLTDKNDYDDWDEQLPIAVAAYNATEHATTTFTPNRLMFNRELMHNFEKMLPTSESPYDHGSWEDYVQKMDDQTRRAFQAAREAIGRNVFLQKKHYDRTANLIKYKVGDTVMIRDHRQYERGTKKLSDRYEGPYYVVDVLSDVHFRITRSPEDAARVMHHDRMKHVEAREDVDTSWVFAQSRTYQRSKAGTGGDAEAMKAVLDRLTKLENKQLEKPRKRKVRKNVKLNNELDRVVDQTVPETCQLPGPTEQPQVQQKRKRGRPRKEDKVQPKPERREGERKSDRLKQKKLK